MRRSLTSRLQHIHTMAWSHTQDKAHALLAHTHVQSTVPLRQVLACSNAVHLKDIDPAPVHNCRGSGKLACSAACTTSSGELPHHCGAHFQHIPRRTNAHPARAETHHPGGDQGDATNVAA